MKPNGVATDELGLNLSWHYGISGFRAELCPLLASRKIEEFLPSPSQQ